MVAETVVVGMGMGMGMDPAMATVDGVLPVGMVLVVVVVSAVVGMERGRGEQQGGVGSMILLWTKMVAAAVMAEEEEDTIKWKVGGVHPHTGGPAVAVVMVVISLPYRILIKEQIYGGQASDRTPEPLTNQSRICRKSTKSSN
jgi:hypothetical protein